MSRPPGTRRQTQGKATGGPAATKGRQPTAAVLVRRAFPGQTFPRQAFSGRAFPGQTFPRQASSERTFPRTRPCSQSRQAPTRQVVRQAPSDKKAILPTKGRIAFFIWPGAIGTNRRDKGQVPRQGEAPPTPAAGYSYCPDLRRSTSSRVRKRQAPRLRFFFVRPA